MHLGRRPKAAPGELESNGDSEVRLCAIAPLWGRRGGAFPSLGGPGCRWSWSRMPPCAWLRVRGHPRTNDWPL